MSLNNLIALQKKAKEAQNTGGQAAESSPLLAQQNDASIVGKQESGDPKPPESPAPAPKRLPFGNSKPKPAATPAPTPAPKPAAPKDGLSLENLGSFDLDDIEEAGTDDASEFAGFHDEIEATAPDRDLPEDLSAAAQNFVDGLNRIYDILNEPEMFGQQIRQIMMELQENPEFEKLVSDTDVHVMIRAMRNTMGLARVRKQAKSRKTGASKTRTPSKKQALMDRALALSTGFSMDVD